MKVQIAVAIHSSRRRLSLHEWVAHTLLNLTVATMIRKFSISNLLDEQAKINDLSSHGKRLSHSSEQTASSQPETQSNTVSSQAEAESRDSPDGVAFNFQSLNQPRPCNKPWFADRTYRRHSAGEVLVKKAARRRYDRGYSLTDTLLRDTLVQDGYVSLPRQLSKPLLQIIDPHTYENIYSAPSMDSLDGKSNNNNNLSYLND